MHPHAHTRAHHPSTRRKVKQGRRNPLANRLLELGDDEHGYAVYMDISDRENPLR
jgi:hypothetical protein